MHRITGLCKSFSLFQSPALSNPSCSPPEQVQSSHRVLDSVKGPPGFIVGLPRVPYTAAAFAQPTLMTPFIGGSHPPQTHIEEIIEKTHRKQGGDDELSLHTGQATSVTPTIDEIDNAAAKQPLAWPGFQKTGNSKSTESECDRDRRLCFRRLAGGAKQGRRTRWRQRVGLDWVRICGISDPAIS